MQHASSQIIETDRANGLKYYLSIVEKENDSGIYNNQRLMFLLEGQHIGYLSKFSINQRVQDLKFQKAKMTALLINIKDIKKSKEELVITFKYLKGTQMVERNWLIKYSTQILCKRWYDLIKKEQVQAFRRKEEAERPKVKIQEGVGTMEFEKKPLMMVSRNMELTQKLKGERETKEAATSVSPKHQEIQKQQIQAKMQEQRQRRIKQKQKSRQKLNSEQELSRIMNEGAPSPFTYKIEDAFIDKQRQLEGTDPNVLNQQKQKEKSIKSEPLFLKNHQFSQRILGDSNKEWSKSNHSKMGTPEDVKKQSRLVQEDSSSPIQEINNKRYLDGGIYPNQPDYFEKISHVIQRSRLSQNQSPNRNLTPVVQKQQYPYQSQNNALHFSNRRQLHMPQTSHQPWTFKYVKHNHLMFDQFKKYTQSLMMELVPDLHRSLEHRKFKAKLIKNNVVYLDIEDIEVKIALVTLDSIEEQNGQRYNQRVGSKSSIKMLQNEFNDYKALYQYLGDNLQLRVPLVSICEYNGFVGLFKILSKNTIMHVNRSLQEEIYQLKQRSRIDCNFNQNINRVIIQLDQQYYRRFMDEGDREVNFDLYFIQQIDNYLLPDVTQYEEGNTIPLRKELIQRYQTDLLAVANQLTETMKLHQPFVYKEQVKELRNLSGLLKQSIVGAARQMDSLGVFFMCSREMAEYLHGRGINLRYLGVLYGELQTTYQKRIVMTEMACRSCKTLFRKTTQDILIEQAYQSPQDQFHSKICDFLNCILGMSHQTASIWQVLSAHAKVYYGMDINYSQIDRWYFVISLIQNCRLDVDWHRISIEDGFKTNSFFGRNFNGLKFRHKVYEPVYCQYYQLALEIIEGEESRENFNKLVAYLSLKSQPIPQHLSAIKYQINKYLAFFISPVQAKEPQFKHLHIYSKSQLIPSRAGFEILLVQIKWYLKLKMNQHYIRSCNDFIKIATRYYGEFHPIFSQLYDIFSAYHLNLCQYEDSITFAKSSLVNILKICGISHQKTSECYYHLALCYIKANRSEEAITHLKKSLHFFEVNKKTETIPHAIMSIKLGMLFLNINEVNQSVKVTQHALRILEVNQKIGDYEEEFTECFQILTRCYEIKSDKGSIHKLGDKCLGKLRYVRQMQHLQKMMKIYLYPILSNLDATTASILINFIPGIGVEPTPKLQEISFAMLKKRLGEDSLSSNLMTYIQRIGSIEEHVREREIMKNWEYLEEIYPRETVKDFISLVTELMVLLGQNFIVGALREAL